MRVVLYARGNRCLKSIDKQFEILQKYAEERGYKVVDKLFDMRKERKDTRPNKLKAFDYLKKNRADAIIFLNFNIFSKTLWDLVDSLTWCSSNAKKLISLEKDHGELKVGEDPLIYILKNYYTMVFVLY